MFLAILVHFPIKASIGILRRVTPSYSTACGRMNSRRCIPAMNSSEQGLGITSNQQLQ